VKKMGKLPEPKSDFLRADDINDGDIIKIIGHPEIIPAEQTKYGRERYVITIVLPDKTVKRWGLNLTSYRTLYKTYGNEGDNWIDKLVKIVKNREKIRGETRHVLYAEPYTEPQQSLDGSANENTDVMQIVDKEALEKLPEDKRERLLRKLGMQQ